MEKVLIEREIPMTAEADVVVAGGGLAGVAAALAAARAGASVILTEVNGFLGGVATAGMVCSVFNCLCTLDREVAVKGIPLEIVDQLAVNGGGPGLGWRNHKGHIIYDVERAKLVLADMLEREGVQIRLNSPVADTIVEDGHVHALVVAGKNGLEAIGCRVLVDATGDCDAAVLAGAPYKSKISTPASYVFRLGNVDTDRFINYFRENPEDYPERMDIDWTLEEALKQYDDNGTFLFPHGGGMQLSLMAKAVENGDLPAQWNAYDALDAMQMHLIRETGVCHIITGFVGNDELDASALTKSINDGKRVAYLFTECVKKYLPGFENAYVSNTADDLGIRGSRAIIGLSTFTRQMMESPYRCKDAIGVGVVEDDSKVLHPGKNAWGVQTFGNDVFEIPLSCLVSPKLDNVIIGAGRGADSEPALVLRVMVVTMSVGQGAGVAAALAAKTGASVKDVDLAALRAELTRQGVVFPD